MNKEKIKRIFKTTYIIFMLVYFVLLFAGFIFNVEILPKPLIFYIFFMFVTIYAYVFLNEWINQKKHLNKTHKRIALKTIKLFFIIFISLEILISSVSYLFDFSIIETAYTKGVSNGKPYCLECIVFYTKHLPPIKGLNVIYKADYDNYTYLNHEFYGEKDDYYIARAKVPYALDYFKKEYFYGVVLFQIKKNVTDDFMEACLKENEEQKEENSLELCNEYYENAFGEPYSK